MMPECFLLNRNNGLISCIALNVSNLAKEVCQARADFKFLLTYKTLSGLAPSYLTEEYTPYLLPLHLCSLGSLAATLLSHLLNAEQFLLGRFFSTSSFQIKTCARRRGLRLQFASLNARCSCRPRHAAQTSQHRCLEL